MVQVTVDNAPVSVQLGAGESVSVPTGETWKVDSMQNDQYCRAQVNGVKVRENSAGEHSDGSLVLVAGDTVKNVDSTGAALGMHLGGWVVA